MLGRLLEHTQRHATRVRILAVGWALFLVYAYPGFMSTDSVDQLLQARNAYPINNWQPPMMAFIWRWTDRVVAGPFPMLVLQSTAFLLGLDGILRRVMAPRAAAVTAIALLLFPPMMTTMAVIWKDSQMAGYLVAGLACLLSPSRRWRLVGLGLFSLATAVRYNAPAATLPLVGLLFVWRDGLPWLRRYAIAVAAWLALTVTAFGANAVINVEPRYPWHNAMALFDIAGTFVGAGAIDDDDARELLDGAPLAIHDHYYEHIHAIYNPWNHWLLSHGDARIFEDPTTQEQRDGIRRVWLRIVTKYPLAYVAHRLRVFQRVLGATDDDLVEPVYDGFTENPAQTHMIDHGVSYGRVQRTWLDGLMWMQSSLLFRPHFYAILGLVLLPLCRRDRLAFALVASGLVYELGLLPMSGAADYRYSHWMVVAVVLAAVVLFTGRFRCRSTDVQTVQHDTVKLGS